MFKNKKKGAALISALVLMSVVVCVFLFVSTLLIGGALSNKVQTKKLQNQVTTSKILKDFVDNQTIDGTYDLDVQIYTNEQNTNQKAVVAKKQGADATDLFFYCVCEFDEQDATKYDILAMQEKDFYITTKNVDGTNFYFLADIVKYVEV